MSAGRERVVILSGDCLNVSTAAVIPIKQFRDVKQRLASILNEMERGALAQAMLRDVLAASELCQHIDSLHLISRDPIVRDIAAEFDVETIEEPARRTSWCCSARWDGVSGEGSRSHAVSPRRRAARDYR